MMFGIYTTVINLSLENTVNLQTGLFLKIIEKRWSLGIILGSWNMFFPENKCKHNMSLKVFYENNTKEREDFFGWKQTGLLFDTDLQNLPKHSGYGQFKDLKLTL